jgi:DNA-binding MarR family transcriptional regulator
VKKPSDQGIELQLAAALEATIPRYLAALRQAVEQAEGPDRLTLQQLRCLQAVVAAGGEALTTGLARTLRVAVPTVTRMLDGLVDRGLVIRRADPDSRRQVHIVHTWEGVALLDRYEAVIEAWLVDLVGSLEVSRQRKLLLAIDNLKSILDREEAAN